MGEVLRFPGSEPEPEPTIEESTPAEPQSFEEWRDIEVPHFLAIAADLDGADESTLREIADRLRQQLAEWERGR